LTRRRHILGGGGVVAAIAAALLASGPAPAAADLSNPAGACVVTTTWGEGGTTMNSAVMEPTDVIVVPRAETMRWSARVNGPAEGTVRSVMGSIALVLPAPFGTVTIDQWSGSTGKIETSGTKSLPDLLPAGATVEMRMEHREKGDLFCTASARLRIAGGPDPIAWVSLALTLLFGSLLVLVGIKGGCSFAMRVLGGGLGLLAGAFAGSNLVLFGVVPMDSIATVLLAAVGLITGSFLCKLRRVRVRRKKRDDEDRTDQESRRPVVGAAEGKTSTVTD
jgi:hypothetical protein